MRNQSDLGEAEMVRLADLLDAEANGRPFDRNEAGRLAVQLRDLCPEIAGNMQRIADRMSPAGRHDPVAA
jgi:hypothetical protein